MSEAELERVVVVGASIAGLRAAEELRRTGYRGEITLVGAEQHFPPYDRPPLSKEVLDGSWPVEQARVPVYEDLDAAQYMGRRAVETDFGRRVVILDDGTDVAFDGLIACSGADARQLHCPGSDLAGVVHFRSVEDCVRLRALVDAGRRRVVIVGAGFIGLEVAAVCRRIGMTVTVIDPVSLPMRVQLGEQVARFVVDEHRRQGVDFLLGTAVEALEGVTHVESVRTASGTVVPADLVVVGIGVTPATQWLRGTPITTDDGILCDQYCTAVGVENVVAAGDVARWWNPTYGRLMRIEHWTNAVEQAEYAARSLLGAERDGYGAVPYFWSGQYGLHVQFAGVHGVDDRIVEGSIEDRKFVLESRSETGQIVGVLGVSWPARFQRARQALTSDLMSIR